MKTLERQTQDGELLRYCLDCGMLRPVTIEPASQDNYYAQNVSEVKCKSCKMTLGHLTWEPHEDQ